MAKKKTSRTSVRSSAAPDVSASVDEMLLAALAQGNDSLETGRYLVTFKEGAAQEATRSLSAKKMRVADARDFENQFVALNAVGDADAVMFPEIGVALLGGGAGAAHARSASLQQDASTDSAIESIDPELFVFAAGHPFESLQGFEDVANTPSGEYMRGFLRAAETIAKDWGVGLVPVTASEEEAQVLGATWGINACRVPQSARSGMGIKVAVLDTGVDLGHPDFAGRLPAAQTATFVGQPVQDLHSHGTHCIGTSCGPKSPAGTTPRYGVGYRASIFAGKVLSNSGSSVSSSVLNGMNWAIAKRCQVISMSLGSASTTVQPYYTAAGQAALNNGLLIVAAAGNLSMQTGSPANSPTIFSVASLDPNLSPSYFSNFGKVEIAAPGRDVFSSVPRPTRYGVMSGTSMATPHVAGCAALWAETSSSLRGMALWNKLRASAKRIPFPASKVGSGLVQAP